MIGLAHLKRRAGQYAGTWVLGFLLTGAAILALWTQMDLMDAADAALPFGLALTGLLLGAGVVLTLFGPETPLTKIVVVILALILLLPLLWAPIASAVVIAFFADRPIEYSGAYAAFRIAVSDLLWPLSQGLGMGDVLDGLWRAFQWVASVVGFISAWVNAWPVIRRLLGQEPATA